MHQGSVLSSLLFIIVLEASYREFKDGLPMELLYADDLVLVAETKESLRREGSIQLQDSFVMVSLDSSISLHFSTFAR